jgi:uncharacterized phage protein (TIGR02218 family)
MNKVSRFVTCWKIELTDSRVFCFTDADHDISFDKKLYLSGSYFTPSAIFSSNELGKDNFMVSGVMDKKFISKDELIAGNFAEAYLEVFLLDLNDDMPKKTILKTGWFGDIKYEKSKFNAEIISLGAKTNNLIGKCYSSSCRAEFADQYCGVKKQEYVFIGAVTGLSQVNSFLDKDREEPDDYFTKGILEFTSGKNKGKKYTVSYFIESRICLDSLFDLNIAIGDQYNIIAGCDKSITSCITKFNNALNFRGEPYIPSRHKLLCR